MTSRINYNPQEGFSVQVSFSYRSSRPGMFCKKGALRNFAKFTGKHLCQSLFLNKVEKRDSGVFLFPANFAKFLRTPFLTEHLRWLLLFISYQEFEKWKCDFLLVEN